MGVFVTDEGRFQGWLAALLCCCAAVSEDEYPMEKRSISKRESAPRSASACVTDVPGTSRTKLTRGVQQRRPETPSGTRSLRHCVPCTWTPSPPDMLIKNALTMPSTSTIESARFRNDRPRSSPWNLEILRCFPACLCILVGRARPPS